MDKERILIADDKFYVITGVSLAIEAHGEKYGHKVIATASSLEELEAVLKKEVKPTVALVDNRFPLNGDGERAAKIIKEYSPETIIISFSNDDGLTWGDKNWPKTLTGAELTQRLTEIKHK